MKRKEFITTGAVFILYWLFIGKGIKRFSGPDTWLEIEKSNQDLVNLNSYTKYNTKLWQGFFLENI